MLLVWRGGFALPISEILIAKYISHLWIIGLKVSTIRAALSAISFYHIINQFSDPCKTKFISQVVKGAGKSMSTSTKPKPMPLSKFMIDDVLDVLPSILEKSYDIIMYAAMFTMAYYFV